MKDITIHPETMSKFESIILADLFKRRRHLSVFDPGVYIHTFTHPITKQTEKYTIRLDQKVIRRPSVHAPREDRFEVIDENQLIGEGGFSQVYAVTCTLAPIENNEGLQIKKKKERLVKKQRHTAQELHLVENEFKLTKKAGNVHPKKPAIFDEGNQQFSSYTVMRKLHGTDLMEILNQLYTEQITLTTHKRLTIAMLLLKKMDELHKTGIIHRDLKPDNIMVRLSENELEFFDYGLSKTIEADDRNEAQGSFGYIPPEVMHGEGTNEKSDLYSAAIIIGMLWFADPVDDFDPLEQYYDFPNLFKEKSSDLTHLEKAILRTLLQQMTLTNRETRPSVQEALNQITTLRDNYVNRKIDEMTNEKAPTNNHAGFFKPKVIRHKQAKISVADTNTPSLAVANNML